MEEAPDSIRMHDAPTRAFEWVAQDLVFPHAYARAALCATYLQFQNVGMYKGAGELRKVWVEGMAWPAGEAWLRTQGWTPELNLPKTHRDCSNDLHHLLFHRFCYVAYRMHRDPQVLCAINTFSDVKQVVINRNGGYREVDHCGYGFDTLMDAQLAIPLLLRPACDHPACACTIDPVLKRFTAG